MTSATTSLLDRAGLDRDAARHHIAHGLEGSDDGELFLEYKQSEMLVFDNGRLKKATYDTAQGFGLRAVKVAWAWREGAPFAHPAASSPDGAKRNPGIGR
jgi:predicted Zn-dependent protease